MKTVDRSTFEQLKQGLELAGTLAFRVVTDSMKPLILPGTPITVSRLTQPPSRFDVLVFWDGRLMICHYLWHKNVALTGDSAIYVTRPLNGGGEDLPIEEWRILGVVSSHGLSAWRRLVLIVINLWGRRR